jgi:hypothetical protein
VEDPKVRGPGIFFAHPRFMPRNAASVRDTSFVFNDYDPTTDPGREERIRKCPREPLLKEIRGAAKGVRALETTSDFSLWSVVIEACRDLRPKLEGRESGPESLQRRLDEFVAEWDGHRLRRGEMRRLRAQAAEGLGDEWARIERARIASVLHPNVTGAEQYAKMIVETYRRTGAPKLRVSLALLEPDEQLRDRDKVLRRYKLDPRWPDEVVEQYLRVDTLALHVNSVDYNGPWKLAVPGTAAWIVGRDGDEVKRWPLWDARALAELVYPMTEGLFPRSRSQAASWFFTIDPVERVGLWELRNLRLEYHASQAEEGFGGAWVPGQVRLHVNGREVMKHRVLRRLRHGESVPLPYPLPA